VKRPPSVPPDPPEHLDAPEAAAWRVLRPALERERPRCPAKSPDAEVFARIVDAASAAGSLLAQGREDAADIGIRDRFEAAVEAAAAVTPLDPAASAPAPKE
jgi:hypothetical protein